MANAVAEALSQVEGVQVEMHKLGTPFAMSILNEADAIVFGSPTEYGNVTTAFRTFLESMTELKTAAMPRRRTSFLSTPFNLIPKAF
jgi:multimeric flavodoxin WrbA